MAIETDSNRPAIPYLRDNSFCMPIFGSFMGTDECAMNDDERLAFWQVESAASGRRTLVLFLSLWGIALIGTSLYLGQSGFWTTLVIGVVVASAGTASGGCSGDDNWKPQEPKLELVNEEYKIKAIGGKGIDALTLIAVFREQEDRKAQRRAVWIGASFGVTAVVLGCLHEGMLPSIISAALAIFFVAWAMKIKQVQIKGLGVDLRSSNSK